MFRGRHGPDQFEFPARSECNRAGALSEQVAGYSLAEPWLLVTYGLYAIAFSCWAPVVRLQIKAQRLAQVAAQTGQSLGADYHRAVRLWFVLGWPAFLGLLGVFWLMIAKPVLW